MAKMTSARSQSGAIPASTPPVLEWGVPRNPALSDPSAEEIQASGPPSPVPAFLNPMTPFHKAWRSFVSALTWLLKLDEADAIFRNIPAYYVDSTLRNRTAENGGLLSCCRFWRLDGGERRGMGANGLMILHADGLTAHKSTGRRSLRILFTRLREFLVERAMHILVLFVGAPVILVAERRSGLFVRIISILVVAGIAVRIPAFFRWLISQIPQARTRLEAFLARRRERIEAREVREARALLDRAMREPNPIIIPWTALAEARFTLETGFHQIMIYGPPSAYWRLTCETRDGKRESALLSVPIRTMGYPALGLADLRLAAEARRAGKGTLKAEMEQFAGIPGMKGWIERSIAAPAARA